MIATNRRKERGFTLIELMVSTAVAMVAFAIAVAGMLVFQRSMAASETQRTATESGRDALLELSRSLRRAGFGLEPRFALDFAWFRCGNGQTVKGVGGRDVCRDRVDAPDSLVFVSRNPVYRVDPTGVNGCALAGGCPAGNAWRVNAIFDSATSPTITIEAREGQRFHAGRSLVVSCESGTEFTMVTVSGNAVASADGPLTLSLHRPDPANPFRENAFADGCFSFNPLVFQLDRHAYFVRDFGGTPWLMLDQGLDLDGDGNDPWTQEDLDDVVPIAPQVEDFQVAYVFAPQDGTQAPDSDRNYATGDDRTGTLPEEPDALANAPLYTTPNMDPRRGNLHPANVRAVRVTLVLRSESVTIQSRAQAPGELARRWTENRAVPQPEPEPDGRQRTVVSTTITLRNLESRGMFTF